MYAANEYGTKNDPQKRWHPAPENRDRRSNNRAGTGNTSEMMPKNDRFVVGFFRIRDGSSLIVSGWQISAKSSRSRCSRYTHFGVCHEMKPSRKMAAAPAEFTPLTVPVRPSI